MHNAMLFNWNRQGHYPVVVTAFQSGRQIVVSFDISNSCRDRERELLMEAVSMDV
jgi:hypothetical protein